LSMSQKTPLDEYYLTLNRSGRRLFLQDVPSSLWALILGRATTGNKIIGEDWLHSDVLYFFLRNKVLIDWENV
jgi:hypothetical protein